MHHNSSRIGHQRLFADKHGIWRNLATRPLYARSLLASFWSGFCSLCSLFGSLCAGLATFTCRLVLYLLTLCCGLRCHSIMLELSSKAVSVVSYGFEHQDRKNSRSKRDKQRKLRVSFLVVPGLEC